MELVRKILLKIEEDYVDVALYDIEIDGYDMKTVAYHCKILNDAKLISDYKSQYADGELYSFGVSSLTWEGHEFLDKIRNDSVWNKTKETIMKKGLPMALDVVKEISTAVVAGMIKGAIQGMV